MTNLIFAIKYSLLPGSARGPPRKRAPHRRRLRWQEEIQFLLVSPFTLRTD